MPRPEVQLDAQQEGILRDIARQAERVVGEEGRLDELVARARDAGIPVRHIADTLGVTIRTVYNRLARSADGDHGEPAPHSAP